MRETDFYIVALVPTRNRGSLCAAVTSALEQTRKPDEVIVIYDKEKPTCNKKITILQNKRTENLSGAINTGLLYLLQRGYNPEKTFLAVLDDDDLWESQHLELCIKEARSGNNWIISGIIRRTKNDEKGSPQEIPDTINPRTFFKTNPNIQGSNLFVRLDTLLRAGCFDEKMISTTDRDIGYRLASLPDIKIGITNAHTVIHNAFGEDRLSQPSSPRKTEGLKYFFYKYGPLMTPEEKYAFKKRASDLFNVNIDDPDLNANITEKVDLGRVEETPISVVVGIIASRPKQTMTLIKELKRAEMEGLSIHKIFVLVEGIDKFKQISDADNERTVLIDSEKISLEKFPLRGISPARQKLHLYLYNWLKDNESEYVIWLLDDDVKLGYLDGSRNYRLVRGWNINAIIKNSLDRGLDIGIGMITGSPPIVPISTTRTSLLDYYYNTTALSPCSGSYLNNMPDYYYDYTEKHKNHLEMPIWVGDAPELEDILAGRSITRPVLYNLENSKYNGIISRGGNTLVFNQKSLGLPFNISPVVDGKMCRRGDTIWTMVCKHRYGMRVEAITLPVFHARVNGNTSLSLENFMLDLIGRATVRALYNYYHGKKNFTQNLKNRLKEYLLEYRATSYRVMGLVDMISDSNRETFLELNEIREAFNEAAYKKLEKMTFDINEAVFKDFLDYVTSYNPKEVFE